MAMDENWEDSLQDLDRWVDEDEEEIEPDGSDDSMPDEPEGSYYHFFDDEGHK